VISSKHAIAGKQAGYSKGDFEMVDEETMAKKIARFEMLRADALMIRKVIFENAGMASKSVVEDVMMRKHPGLKRMEAHEILNHIEFHNLKHQGIADDVLDWEPFFDGVKVDWHAGDPFEMARAQWAHWATQIDELAEGIAEDIEALEAQLERQRPSRENLK